MRVITGKYKGRRFEIPRTFKARPTTDFAKENLFNVLQGYLDFDEEFFMKGIRALNKDVPVFKVSGKTGEGFPEVAAWLEEKAKKLEVHEHHHEQHDHHHHD